MSCSVFNIATISEWRAPFMFARSDFQWAIGFPYFFSIDGKYDAGPMTFFSTTGEEYPRSNIENLLDRSAARGETDVMIEVRRDEDGELCGYVDQTEDGWRSISVFGGTLAALPDRAAATAHVLERGLASLAEHWWLRDRPDGEWRVVCIQEASPSSVRVALDYYSMPGVPTLTIERAELGSRFDLRLDPD